ncbi:Abortive infection bacteriophage resistance protein [Aquisalimonas asiatica]|uniref:Abortive infection bacteriophage resistance protein n=2 Tax=Aquisalimonas asiatica TaxID=406100 RepID=A0A1H8VW36_9GAMM|nr:Abortive infection bacteriophage resistance protein [Aquisalimonas asiatica]
MLFGVPSNRRVTLFRGAEMEFGKPATTVDEQVQLLLDRGMVIDDPDWARHYLQHINYYRLTAYWLPFESDHDTHQFRPGTRFDEVLNLYVFDREFRLLLLDAIERVEVSVRTQWAYYMAHRYGPHSYLDVAHATNPRWHAGNLASLEKELARSDEVFIQHYLDTYSRPASPPVWSVCEVMSLGLLSRWLTQLRKGDRSRLAATYKLDQRVLQAFVRHLTYVRNLCAHHSRVWNRSLTVTMELPRKKPPGLAENFHHHEPRKIYNTVAMLAYLLDRISPNHSWKRRLRTLLDAHGIDSAQMGFPSDVWERPLWRDSHATPEH